ncbi:hypothetical protein D9M68_548810 [compost metagenome]
MKSIYEEGGKRYLKKSFCAYLDILGFSQKIKENDLTFFNLYLSVLDKEIKYLTDEHYLGDKDGLKKFELKIFTDNFVFGQPWNDEFGESELGNIFEVLSHIQFEFAKKGIFLRGAISVSELFMDQNIVIGPALIESYKLESESAIFPRIILSKEVEKIVHKHINYYNPPSSSYQNKQYLVDIDGNYFVNYLFHLYDFKSPKIKRVVSELKKHREPVINNLKIFRDDFKLFSKYSWIAKYHNFFCDNFVIPKHRAFEVSEIKIDENLYEKNFEILVK